MSLHPVLDVFCFLIILWLCLLLCFYIGRSMHSDLGKYCPFSLSSLYVWHPASLLYWDRLYHSFSSQSSFLFYETKVVIKSRCKINFQQSTSPVVLKTRTSRLATKLRQKFNRFSPFRKLTSFVTSFTAYVIYAASPDTYNKIGEDNFISLKSFLDKKKTWRSDNEDENWCLAKREGSAV